MTFPVSKRIKDPRNIYIRGVYARHPFGVKPQGNSLLLDPKIEFESRKSSLGALSVLSDDCLMYLLSYVDNINSLKNLMQVSKYLFAYLNDEDLWKKMFINQVNDSNIKWKGSWKKTVLKWENDVIIDVNLNSDVIYRPFQVANIDYIKLFHNLIEDEINMKDMKINSEGRIPRYEKMNMEQFNKSKSPFILTGYSWPNWELESLNKKYGDINFQQESVNWTLSKFIEYLQSNNDESPLYLFDCRSKAMEQIRKEYSSNIPDIFKEDYFKLLANSRPDHSWLIIGSARSGSTFHKDPNNTSAWNACITGMKLWVMLPPHITPPGVTVSDDQSEITSPVGIGEWVLSGFYHDLLKIPEVMIGITFPGECMYVPSNWWHLVINLQDSIAITENFVPKKDLNNVLNFFETKPKQISGFKLNDIKALLEQLPNKSEELAGFLNLLNESDHDLFEDCGELEHLPDVPIFEIFKQLLINNDQKNLIDEYVESKPTAKVKNNWSLMNQLKESSPVSFSFNFSVD